MYSCIFFNDTTTTEIYTLSLRDALPILRGRLHHLGSGALRSAAAGRRQRHRRRHAGLGPRARRDDGRDLRDRQRERSEEHTSELQSRQYLVCRLLLEKKNREIAEYGAST